MQANLQTRPMTYIERCNAILDKIFPTHTLLGVAIVGPALAFLSAKEMGMKAVEVALSTRVAWTAGGAIVGGVGGYAFHKTGGTVKDNVMVDVSAGMISGALTGFMMPTVNKNVSSAIKSLEGTADAVPAGWKPVLFSAYPVGTVLCSAPGAFIGMVLPGVEASIRALFPSDLKMPVQSADPAATAAPAVVGTKLPSSVNIAVH